MMGLRDMRSDLKRVLFGSQLCGCLESTATSDSLVSYVSLHVERNLFG